jgi:hypothetical protein
MVPRLQNRQQCFFVDIAPVFIQTSFADDLTLSGPSSKFYVVDKIVVFQRFWS